MAISTGPHHGEPTESEDAQVNAMYTQLLEAVLAYEADPATQPRSQGPLADVIRLRHTMERHAARTDPGWALQAVADQLAYDAALVRLARKRGVAVGLDAFDIPEQGRAALEEALIALGVNLPLRAESGPDTT
ncbi:MAG TPA: hypothetical protein VII96_10670 [Acidimicrobiales bacterium]